MKKKPEMAAEVQCSMEISQRFDEFHSFFALTLVQNVGEYVV